MSVLDRGTPCDRVRVLSIGEGGRGSDHPVGVTAYTCPGDSGSHTSWEASSDAPVTEEQCQFVPVVTVVGQPIPGTGATYCVPAIRPDDERTVDTPDAVPRTGIVVMFPDPTEPSGYNYVVVSPANEVARRIVSGPLAGTSVTIGVVQARGLHGALPQLRVRAPANVIVVGASMDVTMPIRAVLFDAFGTVIHPEPEWEALRTECLTIVHGTWKGRAIELHAFLRAYEAARAEQHAEVERGLREFDFAERFANTALACGASDKEARSWGPVAAEKYHRFQQGLIHAYDAPGPTLARLKADGRRIALVSNYAHTGVLEDALTRLGIRQHFDALVVSGDVGYLKPHPRIFEVAVETLGVAKNEAVMVGNDLACDITGAKRAGLRTIWTPYPRESPAPTHPDADAVVERLADIPGILPKM